MTKEIAKVAKVIGPPGCLSEFTMLVLRRGKRNSGRQYTIREAYLRFNQKKKNRRLRWNHEIPTMILSLKNDIIGYHSINAIVYSGEKETFTITTEKGRKLCATNEQLFKIPVSDIFVPLHDLDIGDKILCRNTDKKKNGRQDSRPRNTIYSVPFHPYAWDHWINKRNYKRTSMSRAVLESRLNGMSLSEFISIIRNGPATRISDMIFLPDGMAVHHRNSNTLDDRPENLEIKVKREHDRLHGKKDGMKNFGDQLSEEDIIINIEPYKIEPTYDIMMDPPYHNYIVNDFIVHNSGKTTYLLGLIEAAAQKYDPNRVGAVSFTVAAVNEMRDRVSRSAGISKRTIKNCRTIHSHCFRLLEMNREKVADEKIDEWNKTNPQWELLSNTMINEDDHYNGDVISRNRVSDNLRLFNRMQVRRNRMIPVEKWARDEQLFFKDWKKWTYLNDYIDYTGMLELVIERELIPEIDILFVDEAQDLTPLQMAVVDLWSRETVSTVLTGDSDQALFRFSGAVPEVFINLEHGFLKELDQSYRVPKTVHKYADNMIRQIRNRENVSYKPTEVEGEIFYGLNTPLLDMDGTHMIIARCNYHLHRWRDFLMMNGVPWHNPYRLSDRSWNPTSTKLWRAAKAYVTLKYGLKVSNLDFKAMVKEMIVKGNLTYGAKARVDEIDLDKSGKMDIFESNLLKFFLDTEEIFKKPVNEIFNLKKVQAGDLIKNLKHETELMNDPRVVLGTIHSIKGSESTHVWIDTGTSRQCLIAMNSDPTAFDDEVRVGYVAATRARQTLGFLRANGFINPVFPMI